MKFYVYSHRKRHQRKRPWVAFKVHATDRFRDVWHQINDVLDVSTGINLDGFPDADLVTEKFFGIVRHRSQQAKRVNVQFAYAADMQVGHIPLLRGGTKLFLEPVWYEITNPARGGVRITLIGNMWMNDYYACDTAPVRDDGTPLPLK